MVPALDPRRTNFSQLIYPGYPIEELNLFGLGSYIT